MLCKCFLLCLLLAPLCLLAICDNERDDYRRILYEIDHHTEHNDVLFLSDDSNIKRLTDKLNDSYQKLMICLSNNLKQETSIEALPSTGKRRWLNAKMNRFLSIQDDILKKRLKNDYEKLQVLYQRQQDICSYIAKDIQKQFEEEIDEIAFEIMDAITVSEKNIAKSKQDALNLRIHEKYIQSIRCSIEFDEIKKEIASLTNKNISL